MRKIGRVIEKVGGSGNIKVITGGRNSARIASIITGYLGSDGFQAELIRLRGDLEHSILEEMIKDMAEASVIMGVGGGKVVDAAKFIANRKKTRCVIFPSSLSTDAIASPWSIIRQNGKLVAYYVRPPSALVVDLDIIASAPLKLTVAGFCDYISKFSALPDWRLDHRRRGIRFSEEAAAIAESILHMLTRYAPGIQSLQEDALRVLAVSLYLDGFLMELAGSTRVAAGSEHLFSFALDKVAGNPAPHGLECGLGTILMTNLQGGDWWKVRDIIRRAGAPTTAEELGVRESDVIKALVEARGQRDWYTILDEKPLDPRSARRLAEETGVI